MSGVVVRVDFRSRRPLASYTTADEWYRYGCTLDENPATYAAAKSAYERALKLEPQCARVLSNLGNVLVREGDQRGAMRLYRRALKADPGLAEAHYNLGWCYLQAGKRTQAIACLRRAVDLDPYFGDARYNLADALWTAGKRTDAAPHLRRFLALEPASEYSGIARTRLQSLRWNMTVV